MSRINEETMKTISATIFKVAEMFPGKVKVMDARNLDSDITKKFGKQFEAEFSIDDPAVVEKIKEIATRPFRNYVWVVAEPSSSKYKLYV